MAKEKKVKEKKIKEKKEKKGKESKSVKNYFNQKTFLGVTLAGVLILAVVYVFVYLDFTQRTEELEKSNTELAATVKELEEYNVNMENYKLEIEEIKAEINNILSVYPSDVREEDVIMLAVNLQENNTIDFDAVSMEEREDVYTIDPGLVTAAAIEGLDESLVFRQKRAAYVNQTTYTELKSVIEQIYASDNRIGISSIVYSRDEEFGILDGSIDVYFYSLAGTDKEYEAPDIKPYTPGTSDPFKSEEVARRAAMEMLDEITDGEGGNGAEENAE